MMGTEGVHPAFTWLWHSICQQKHKVFFWLLLQDKLNTRGLLRRKHIHLDSYTFELCLLQKEERLRHLFLACLFAKNCWGIIGIQVPSWMQPQRAIRRIKRSLGVLFAMEIIITMCWSIWNVRNGWLFKNEDPTVDQYKLIFKREIKLITHRSKRGYVSQLQVWLQNLD
jgi:hypothetical protein